MNMKQFNNKTISEFEPSQSKEGLPGENNKIHSDESSKTIWTTKEIHPLV